MRSALNVIITTSPHRAGTNTVNVIPSSLSPLSDQLCELDGQAPPGLASSEIGIVVVCERDLRAVSVVEYSSIISLDGIPLQSTIVVEVDSATAVWKLVGNKIFGIWRLVISGGKRASIDYGCVNDVTEDGDKDSLDDGGVLHFEFGRWSRRVFAVFVS